MVLEKTLESPLDCKEILKEISPGISLEGMMLKLKLQYFGHLMRRMDSLEKTLMLGGIGGKRRRGWQRMRWLDGITDSGLLESSRGSCGSSTVCAPVERCSRPGLPVHHQLLEFTQTHEH